MLRKDGKALEEGTPNQLVKSVEWTGWPDEHDDDDKDFRVIDFGESFAQNAGPEQLAQPRGMQAPETILTQSLDTGSTCASRFNRELHVPH